MESVQDFLSAKVDDAKLVDYLFNPDHNEGYPKGKFLILLGFDSNDLGSVRAALISQATLSKMVTSTTQYGIKIECDGAITSPSSASAFVRTVWQTDIGAKSPRFITFKPLRKQV